MALPQHSAQKTHASKPLSPEWVRVPICHIEDLADAIHGAGLRPIQMSRTPVNGSLLFAERNGFTFSSGRMEARVSLRGSLSESQVTFGFGATLTAGSRQWLREVTSGDMGLFMPGDEHDALYGAGSLYAAVTMTEDRAEEMAATLGHVLKPRKLGSAILSRQICESDMQRMRNGFEEIHATGRDVADMGSALLRLFLKCFGRAPRSTLGAPDYRGRNRIVRMCRDYIDTHLHRSLSIEELAIATGTSSRTLFRSFTEVLGETPLHYIQQLRLHRIREDLLGGNGAHTVAAVANRWGISELGRFAGQYRETFGETPSQTLSRHPFRPPIKESHH